MLIWLNRVYRMNILYANRSHNLAFRVYVNDSVTGYEYDYDWPSEHFDSIEKYLY